MLNKLLSSLKSSDLLWKIFHTLDYCLKKELSDCESVLDLGCGPSSPLQYCKNIKYSVWVEWFEPYLKQSQEKWIHNEYIPKSIQELDFPENSFDAVIMIEVLEHLNEKDWYEILKKIEKLAKKKIIISTPNWYFPMDAVDNNEYQRHLSWWDVEKLSALWFDSYWVSWAKFFYKKQNSVHSLNQENAIFSNMRFRPQVVFYIVNSFFQIITYFFPRYAFGLFAVKRIKDAI